MSQCTSSTTKINKYRNASICNRSLCQSTHIYLTHNVNEKLIIYIKNQSNTVVILSIKKENQLYCSGKITFNAWGKEDLIKREWYSEKSFMDILKWTSKLLECCNIDTYM
jgi:hypothetical protein